MCDRPFRANHPNHGDNPSRKHATHTRESTLSTTSKPSKKPRYSVSGVSYPFFGQKNIEKSLQWTNMLPPASPSHEHGIVEGYRAKTK